MASLYLDTTAILLYRVYYTAVLRVLANHSRIVATIGIQFPFPDQFRLIENHVDTPLCILLSNYAWVNFIPVRKRIVLFCSPPPPKIKTNANARLLSRTRITSVYADPGNVSLDS